MTESHAYPDKRQTEGISYQAELWRKGLHLASALIPLSLLVLDRSTVLGILIPLTLLALTAEGLRARSATVQSWLNRYVGFMMRAEECLLEGQRLCINGATWVLISCTLVILLFPVPIAIAALLIALIGDGIAALVGRRWGKHPIGSTAKTWEGTIAFIGASLLVLFPLHLLPFPLLLIGTLAGAIAEIVPFPLNDNLRIPLLSAFVMWLISFF